MLTVKLLNLRRANISGSVHFLEDILYDLGLFWTTSSPKMVEIDLKPAVDVSMNHMVSITEFTRIHTLLECPGLTGGTIFVGTADIQCFVTLGTAKAGETVCG